MSMCKRNPKIHENWPYSLKIGKKNLKIAIKSKIGVVRGLNSTVLGCGSKSYILEVKTLLLVAIYFGIIQFPDHACNMITELLTQI